VPGERVEDDVLIKADKNPNRSKAEALFAPLSPSLDDAVPPDADLLLVWGEGFDLSLAPRGAKVILLDSYAKAQNATADVFIPISIQTERNGHYTNFAGVVTPFEACFQPVPTIAHAADLFAALAAHISQPMELRA
jgi:NADH-quinone oxidoreductase subunit G